MAKYTGADCRLCRREGCKLYLKGDKCYSESVLPLQVNMALQERNLQDTAFSCVKSKKQREFMVCAKSNSEAIMIWLKKCVA